MTFGGRSAAGAGRLAAMVWLWLFDGYVYGAVTSKVHGFTLPPTRDLNSIAKATVS